MTLFGICPDQEEILLVVCRECGRVVKAAAFLRHCGKLPNCIFPSMQFFFNMSQEIELCEYEIALYKIQG